jgi:O-antigen ligase
MQYIGIGKMLQTIEGRFGGTFMDSNVLGFIVGISIPMCLSLFFNNEFRKMGFLVPILFFLLYVSGSRSGFIIVIVACSLFFCLLKSWKKRGVFIALIFLSCSFFLFLVRRDVQKGKGVRIVHETKTMVSAVSLLPPVPSAPPLSPAPQQENVTVSAEKRPGFLTKSVNYILASRGALWDLAGRVIKDHWLFGVGLGRYMTVSQGYTTDIVNDNACNMYLQVAAEQGIIAAVVFFVMLLWILWPFSRLKQSSLFHRATSVTLVGVLVAFVFGAHIVNSEANIFFWYLIAILGAPVEHHS